MNTPKPIDQAARVPLSELLARRITNIPLTWGLIATNLLVFASMLAHGAGLWHSSNAIQLAWGANFAPATQDGQWWRLGSALFLHFGAVHLLMNMAALLDGGRLAERMYGHLHFLLIYIVSGLSGNLLSLLVQGNAAVSGGASGAIFGVYGSILTCLWLQRDLLDAGEFRWMFGGALLFSAITIVLGFIIPGIDNSAHIGGFITGLVAGVLFAQPLANSADSTALKLPITAKAAAGISLLLATVVMLKALPPPLYRWSEELKVRKQLNDFVRSDQAANRSWLEIANDSKQSTASFAQLADRVDQDITNQYEESFEQLSELPLNPALPSAKALETTLIYTQEKRDAARALAAKLRAKGREKSQ